LRADRLLGERGIQQDTPAGRQEFERHMERRRFLYNNFVLPPAICVKHITLTLTFNAATLPGGGRKSNAMAKSAA
jgi:hypothetical protein